jgi:DNA polymerase
MGEGNPRAAILLIGEAPGENEDLSGRPFVGRAGQLLDRTLEEARVGRGDVYITNVVRCRPTAVQNGAITNRAPRAGEIAACAPWRWLEINLVDPRVVVCVGGPAAKALIDKKFKLTEQRGQLFRRDDGRTYIATLHPAYVLRLQSTDREAYHRARGHLIADLALARTTAGL